MRLLLAHAPKLFALLLLVPALAFAQSDEPRPIGWQSEETYEVVKNEAPSLAERADHLSGLISTVQFITLAATLLAIITFVYFIRLTGFDPFKGWKPNLLNARGMLLFMVVFFVGIAIEWYLHSGYTLIGDAASEHGKDVDSMLIWTLAITGLGFIITQILLFVWSYMYRSRPGRQASYYHDNSRLEMAWTIVIAVVMIGLVSRGISVWTDVTYTDRHDTPTTQFELVGQQFNWNVRYPGPDGVLGSTDYQLTTNENSLALDFADKAGMDDAVPTIPKIVLPVNEMVRVNIRSRDVLHGVYMPHFRVQIYAVPGMPTHLDFTPTMTTEEMRKRTGNPEFVYELACSQLCGDSHYNMRVEIEVVGQKEYEQWKRAFEPENVYVTPSMIEAQKDRIAQDNPEALKLLEASTIASAQQ